MQSDRRHSLEDFFSLAGLTRISHIDICYESVLAFAAGSMNAPGTMYSPL
jgi:hypothetical protein